ncbi:pentapeptide repeat-containing protein [Pseudomonas juntendi]|uniref:pentapeptide repeat-containing protein n=1 Tax=Pseudomonas juntendi TaxID=2666183 RepID=UPI0021752FA5|nr:pentapeptide repeat-containing protein [Pseudomonas juntendi]
MISPAPANRALCLRLIAQEYGLTYKQIVARDRMIARYAAHCFAEGFWRQPYDGVFRRARFLLQFDALVECLRDRVPLAAAAHKRGVDFSGFHFSSLLFKRINRVLTRKKVPDMSYLQAPGSLVHYDWFQDVKKASHANFSNAKFYTVTGDPVVQPGAYGWETDFDYADLRGVDLRGAYLRGATFVGAKMEGADLRNANINECIFTGASGAFVSGEILYHNWDVGPRGVEPWLPDDEG